MLTATRSWIKGWLRAITVGQSVKTVLPVTDRQTVPLSYRLRDLHLTRVISVFMISRLYYCNSLFLHIKLPSLKWKSIQNITPSQRHSLQPTIPYPLYPILSSAATLNSAKNWKMYFPFQCFPGEWILYLRAGCTACHLDLPQQLQWTTVKSKFVSGQQLDLLEVIRNKLHLFWRKSQDNFFSCSSIIYPLWGISRLLRRALQSHILRKGERKLHAYKIHRYGHTSPNIL